MPASKLKNLVILILLLCNVFLLILVVPGRLAARQQREALRNELVALYAGYGLTLRRGYRSLGGMNGDIACAALTMGELFAAGALMLF